MLLLQTHLSASTSTRTAGAENKPPVAAAAADAHAHANGKSTLALKRISEQLRMKDRRIGELEFSLQMLQKEAALAVRLSAPAAAPAAATTGTLRDATNTRAI